MWMCGDRWHVYLARWMQKASVSVIKVDLLAAEFYFLHESFRFVSLRACLEVLAREHTTCIPWTEDRSSSTGESLHPLQLSAQPWERHTWSTEGGRGHCLACQISQTNLGDPWGERCRSQMALTSSFVSLNCAKGCVTKTNYHLNHFLI